MQGVQKKRLQKNESVTFLKEQKKYGRPKILGGKENSSGVSVAIVKPRGIAVRISRNRKQYHARLNRPRASPITWISYRNKGVTLVCASPKRIAP